MTYEFLIGVPAMIRQLTGFLICFRTWEALEENFNRINTELPKHFKAADIRKGYNPLGLQDAISYPFTLALIVKGSTDLKTLDNLLCNIPIDFKGDHEIFTGNDRIMEYMGFFNLNDKYIPGVIKIKYGRCDIGGYSGMSCMMCNYGHMLECHYPLNCQAAKCQHSKRYDETLN